MKSLFSNHAQLGAFGEYVYQIHVQSSNLTITPVRILECDFLIRDEKQQEHQIDVKTTSKRKTKYGGKRIRPNLSYDLVIVDENLVLLAPDHNSPLNKNGELQEIGGLTELYEKWLRHKDSRDPKHERKTTPHHNKRFDIKRQVLDIFSPLRIRVVFRGSVSEDRWSSLPDNLPGSSSIVAKHDGTVFIQMRTMANDEAIAQIIVFSHCHLDIYPMKPADSRQQKKGITSVLDIPTFEENFPELVFHSLEELRSNPPSFGQT